MFWNGCCQTFKKNRKIIAYISIITCALIILSVLSILLYEISDFHKVYIKMKYIARRIYYSNSDALYLVIDLSKGPSAQHYPYHFTNVPPDISEDICRTSELWLRYIPAGTFLMGSPTDELGRFDDEMQHKVTITQHYFIGIFPCTQKQYQLIMGENYSSGVYKGENHPADSVSYIDLRGKDKGSRWPMFTDVDDNSFFGVLRAKTGLNLDLPTEAQWEYACRAGTITALNSGKNLTNKRKCTNLDELGKYAFSINGKNTQVLYLYNNESITYAHSRVGGYCPNAWGIYDCHGNVLEWCLDWYGEYTSKDVLDPMGPTSGTERVLRGGCHSSVENYGEASSCRSASRFRREQSDIVLDGNVGFRIAL